ncbi:hypothetical protein LEP1GSC052_2899 [Leptospira kmetyi serovar Malaysia str. Bejo-Iso9]|nr:hypothetical protein LEP1GSC052_2899 [Leptospira kmetyi serovar Malaysia str. Bejo-Iso9]
MCLGGICKSSHKFPEGRWFLGNLGDLCGENVGDPTFSLNF